MPSDEPYVRPKISRHVSKPRGTGRQSDRADTGSRTGGGTGGTGGTGKPPVDANGQQSGTESERTTGRSDRAEDAERTRHVDRAERVDRVDRSTARSDSGAGDRTDIPDRTRQADRTDRTRSDRTDRSASSTGGERADAPDRAGRSEWDRSNNRGDRTGRTERTGRSDRTDRTDRTDVDDRSDGTDRSNSTGPSGRSDREGESAGTVDDARGGRPRPLMATNSRHLKASGPMVSTFHGRVEKVFGTSQRAKPSSRPVAIAIFIAILAFAAPYAVAYLPVILICLLGLVWIRKKLGDMSGIPLPKFGEPTQNPGLQIVTFRVRIPRDDDPESTFRMINCRFIQKADAGPIQLVASDLVTGSGRKTSGGVIEVSRLSVGEGPTTLHSTSPKSDAPIFLLAALIVAAAGIYLYFRWNSIPPVSWQGVLYPLISALLPIVVIWFIVKKLLFRR